MTVAVVMGSDSDLATLRPAIDTLDELGIDRLVQVVSAHRDPHGMLAFAAGAADAGIEVIIAGAGGAAHLPGMIASATHLPVIGVPVGRPPLDGLDALLSIVQMPAGIPVATMAVDGAANAALFAARILAARDPAVAAAVLDHQRALLERVARANEHLVAELDERRAGADRP